jgi:hypothetical protein
MLEHPDTRYWISGQDNIIRKAHPAFPAAYCGPNSFRDIAETATANVGTLYLGYSTLSGAGRAGLSAGGRRRAMDAKALLRPITTRWRGCLQELMSSTLTIPVTTGFGSRCGCQACGCTLRSDAFSFSSCLAT